MWRVLWREKKNVLELAGLLGALLVLGGMARLARCTARCLRYAAWLIGSAAVVLLTL
jgi:hypothetical protein